MTHREQAVTAEELANAALALSAYQASTDADEVDLGLTEALLQYICEVRGGCLPPLPLLLLAAHPHTLVPCPPASSLQEGVFKKAGGGAAGEPQVMGAVLIFLPGEPSEACWPPTCVARARLVHAALSALPQWHPQVTLACQECNMAWTGCVTVHGA